MDNGAHRDNGRPKTSQQQWVMQHPPSMKQIMSLMAERDHAIQERNLALKDKKSALAERDFAIRQRDTAISDRDTAISERQTAISALQYRLQNPPKNRVNSHFEDFQSPSPPPPDPPKAKKREKRAKSPQPTKKKAKKSNSEDFSKKPNWKDESLSLNQVTYDDSTMPVPVCSCTGVYRPCYKWGSGGWQSACCTTTLSVYPLPPVPNKKHARIGGRKMSGSAFNKLLTRLASQGYDLSNPVDLKDNWARHGTNRYITLK